MIMSTYLGGLLVSGNDEECCAKVEIVEILRVRASF